MMKNWNDKIIGEFRSMGGRVVSHPQLGALLGEWFEDRLLLLTAKGRRSGQSITVPLAYHRDGDRYVVAASKGGSPTHPAWYHNLVAHREATVEVGKESFHVRAMPLPRGPERDRLYEEHSRQMPGFRDYPKKTKRIIPVVVLERI